MEETKEKKEKSKKKPSIGDIIFRVLILLGLFLAVLVFYVSYIRKSISNQILNDVNTVKQIESYQ